MYIPQGNLATDTGEITAFMQRFSFAAIITARNGLPLATHLPFVVVTNGNDILLRSHFARANSQWQEIQDNKEVLVIFSEPHAYISPKHYEKELNVPTWNYIAVHAYGQGRIISETAAAFALLEQTINTYEAEYKRQWDSLPSDYRLRMLKGIVAFEIAVTDLQAKKKLSQNKTENEQRRIIDSLAKSGRDNEQQIAQYMQENLKGRHV
ncbi:PaiB family negative transcriptional regulator [Anseongella ginsenosidimutans]|uniref:PaiB family negative transcriptional regulator n=1 Tax=Anseongella ginsenosidimutans TaxID=496056 RepID=A0A4R3KM19_9SPHI|nr:FMN-binding negative transcriptional regulator [Anseongella ginsenosidimutans]QEC53793.1 FMN-binding negative transcriptional regulator [Anseongella ginsenosidimutans]TCS84935.1 PaiB family negative transcriptional regulator [Anseongella ginsenosidimutans]